MIIDYNDYLKINELLIEISKESNDEIKEKIYEISSILEKSVD